DSDKVTLEVPAPESGVLQVSADEGAEMNVGDTIGAIDTTAARQVDAGASVPASTAAAPDQAATTNEVATETQASSVDATLSRATSLARKIAADHGVDVNIRRERMTKLRQRIAERLVQAQHSAAMLTTFNEIDMTNAMELRKRFKEPFMERYGVGLGFMSIFAKACASALQAFPRINAYIIGDEVEFHDFIDISVAVGTDKGLVVPVIRNVEQMTFADIEGTIKDFAVRAREGKLTIDEMTGGTFTMSNGGVYGSLNSTPILNPPQSGILGMHKIAKRPIEDPDAPGQIALRPMMYVALSYDHRIVDGAEAVGFLIHVKNCVESPERMLLGL
ncbi:MAG: dihydrolipoyllysine-residue succinyltransferase, partial [Planctomycetota bacterium]